VSLRIDLCGEAVLLLPERALLWEGAATLILADAHLGKAAAFRAAALPLPGGTTSETLGRLSMALEYTEARLVLLGDFFHARSGRAARTLGAISAWRERHAALEVLLVRGNHDRGAGDPPPEWRFQCVEEPFSDPPFAFRHFPPEEPGSPESLGGEGYVLAGHVHPVVALEGGGRWSETLPCFLFGETGGILPAFGAFTGGGRVRPRPGDRVFAVAGDAVVGIQLAS
jgi:DNA ligase-associated metallophosphoesterase